MSARRRATPRGPGATVLLSLLLVGAGCGEDVPEREGGQTRVDRRMLSTEWRAAWVRGGSETDTLMLLPAGLAVDDGLVYVLDRMGHRIVTFRAADGAHAWSTGREGGGPGEIRRPSAIAAIPGEGVVVADPGNARLSFLDRAGGLRREVPLPDASIVSSICPLADGSLLLARIGHGAALVRVGAGGETAERRELPWRDLNDGSLLRRQSLLAPTGAGDGCIVALGLGRGFATYGPRGFGPTHAYVEPLEIPAAEVRRNGLDRSERLTDLQMAATSLSTSGGQLVVGFQGLSPDAGWLVDHYDEATGAYLFSYRAPVPLERVARAGSRYYVLTRLEGYPALVAFEVRETAAAPQPRR